ncbi:ribbon-helix-helix domain-containing protein [Ahrensia sp. R2A130]|uniref:ribbon-helix-helix domain-containing protein n=1 Tax=Ahrensia sp. R2A130 TaxID=744979 RepID=UPI0001E0BC5D|nr:ribbon-helix-helix domain-containing protein [Ahrensia sp. R2A130]EFL90783.1 arylsulfate sulfotransferase-like protein [Ahrensia sp. R2A130]
MSVKRSITIRGHRTSFSLEDEFWAELKALAATQGVSLSQLVAEIDTTRGTERNLSSALRLYVFNHLKKLATENVAT